MHLLSRREKYVQQNIRTYCSLFPTQQNDIGKWQIKKKKYIKLIQ